MRPPRRGEIWTTNDDPPLTVLVISSTVYNEISCEPTVLTAAVINHATAEGFCVDLGNGQWAIMGLVTYLDKRDLVSYERRVSTQTLTDVNTMLFRILATPER